MHLPSLPLLSGPRQHLSRRGPNFTAKRECSQPLRPIQVKPDDLSKVSLQYPPESPGVYVFFSAADEPLYIGETNNFARRKSEHAKTKPWFKHVTYAKFVEFKDSQDRLMAETVLIFYCRPRHNRSIAIGIGAHGKLYPLQFLAKKKAANTRTKKARAKRTPRPRG